MKIGSINTFVFRAGSTLQVSLSRIVSFQYPGGPPAEPAAADRQPPAAGRRPWQRRGGGAGGQQQRGAGVKDVALTSSITHCSSASQRKGGRPEGKLSVCIPREVSFKHITPMWCAFAVKLRSVDGVTATLCAAPRRPDIRCQAVVH